ncbi:MAG TPA: BTAD domain-containing putative transcriptional regulator [Rugosimonospora sp.]|nr:BTAD domain-containing putative transcriptional regulator [Rugosimonospora sp.]
MTLEFGLLGDLRVDADGRPLDVGHARQQSVLAVLLVEANRTVSPDELVDRVWGERRLPKRPSAALQTYISLLRRALGPTGAATIERRPAGYQLHVDEKSIDLHRFRAMIDKARATAHDQRAAALLEQALGLWRGEPFPRLDTAWVNATRNALTQERHAAQLDLADLYLRLGRHSPLLAELVEWVEHNPLDERLAGQYMLALYREGRQADALAHYERVRRRLTEQLGTDPCRALQVLHERILISDPALAAPAARSDAEVPYAVAPAAALPKPQQLPSDTAHFTGRRTDLVRLDEALGAGADDSSNGPVIISIHGAPGVGKTTLAVHWALRARRHFPDGQLYVDLRGFDRSNQPLDPAEVLDGFLRALNVAAEQIPPGLDTRTGLYRSLLAGRRMLVLLDNAATVNQVRPLLPNSPRCLVIVTSRSRLTGLATREGVHRVGVTSLSEHEAVELLGKVIGPSRTGATPATLVNLARRCGCLPLALRIAAERVAVHPHLPLTRLVDELADVQERLNALTADSEDADAGESVAVRTVFSWSYRALPTAAARMFRLLSLHPGPQFSFAAAAALVGLPPARTAESLETLTSAHLIAETGPDRFGFHDLLRTYAAECATADEPEPVRAAVTRRILTWYLHTADAAVRTFSPANARPSLAPEDACAPLAFGSRSQALTWCETELPNLVAATVTARNGGENVIAWQLPVILWDFFSRRKHWAAWLTTHRIGLAAARQIRHREGEAWVLNMLGPAYRDLKRFDEALDCFQRARRIWQATGALVGQGWTLYNTGDTLREIGRYEEAIEYLLRSLVISRESGIRWGEGWTLNMLGDSCRRLGRFAEAIDYLRQSLEIRQETGDAVGHAMTLNVLGHVHRDMGSLPDALRFFRDSLLISRENSQPQLEACNLLAIGDALHERGEVREARESWHVALTVFERIKDPRADEARSRLTAPDLTVAPDPAAGAPTRRPTRTPLSRTV